MFNIKIIGATAFVLFAVAFVFSQNAATEIAFKDSKQNFGFVREGEQVVMEFVFENKGNQPVLFVDYKVACSCTKVEFPKQPVKPGEKGVVVVKFDTKGKFDRQDRTVQLFSNATGSPHSVRFKGVVLKKKE